MGNKPYHNIIAWERSHEFVVEIYRCTQSFPKHELYGLVSQLRRAASSVPTNIVEGRARNTEKDFLRFLNIAHASLAECEYLLELSYALRYLTKNEYDSLEDIRSKSDYLIRRYILSIEPPATCVASEPPAAPEAPESPTL
jgi:four helix bundle protein